MNKKQRLAVLVGSVLVALSLLFPTYNIREYSKGQYLRTERTELGFLFSPPPTGRSDEFRGGYEAVVDLPSALLRVVFFAALTAGAVVFLGDGRRTPSDRT